MVSIYTHMYECGPQKHLIYLDETGYNLYTEHTTYGRAPRDERVNGTVERNAEVTSP